MPVTAQAIVSFLLDRGELRLKLVTGGDEPPKEVEPALQTFPYIGKGFLATYLGQTLVDKPRGRA